MAKYYRAQETDPTWRVNSPSEPIIFDLYTGWLLTLTAQNHFVSFVALQECPNPLLCNICFNRSVCLGLISFQTFFAKNPIERLLSKCKRYSNNASREIYCGNFVSALRFGTSNFRYLTNLKLNNFDVKRFKYRFFGSIFFF